MWLSLGYKLSIIEDVYNVLKTMECCNKGVVHTLANKETLDTLTKLTWAKGSLKK